MPLVVYACPFVVALPAHRLSQTHLSARCLAGSDVTPREAVIEFLEVRDLYDGEPTTLAEYDPARLKIFDDDWRIIPQSICDVAPDDVKAMFRNPDRNLIPGRA